MTRASARIRGRFLREVLAAVSVSVRQTLQRGCKCFQEALKGRVLPLVGVGEEIAQRTLDDIRRNRDRRATACRPRLSRSRVGRSRRRPRKFLSVQGVRRAGPCRRRSPQRRLTWPHVAESPVSRRSLGPGETMQADPRGPERNSCPLAAAWYSRSCREIWCGGRLVVANDLARDGQVRGRDARDPNRPRRPAQRHRPLIWPLRVGPDQADIEAVRFGRGRFKPSWWVQLKARHVLPRTCCCIRHLPARLRLRVSVPVLR
jgi:hypothetical protein